MCNEEIIKQEDYINKFSTGSFYNYDLEKDTKNTSANVPSNTLTFAE